MIPSSMPPPSSRSVVQSRSGTSAERTRSVVPVVRYRTTGRDSGNDSRRPRVVQLSPPSLLHLLSALPAQTASDCSSVTLQANKRGNAELCAESNYWPESSRQAVAGQNRQSYALNRHLKANSWEAFQRAGKHPLGSVRRNVSGASVARLGRTRRHRGSGRDSGCLISARQEHRGAPGLHPAASSLSKVTG